MSYIVKNCPCYYLETCGAKDVEEQYCADCTDCKLKQIVELCKNKDYFVKEFPNAQFSSGVQNSELAFDILQLLDIKDVE